jgi:hypothetical protein
MEPTDLTIEILKDIRDGVRGTNTRIDATNARIDETNARLDARIDETNVRLDTGLAGLRKQQAQTEIRLATELVAVSTAVRDLTEVLRARDGGLRARVEDHERRLDVLEKKSG